MTARSTSSRRRFAFRLGGLALALAAAAPAFAQGAPSFREGKVFTSTNATGGNELLVYAPGQGVIARIRLSSSPAGLFQSISPSPWRIFGA